MSVFDEAYSSVSDVSGIVEDRIQDAVQSAEGLRQSAQAAISALGNVNLSPVGTPPAPPSINRDFGGSINLPPVSASSFGEITSSMPDMPNLGSVPSLTDLDIPDFESSISAIQIPEAPAPGDLGAVPTRPDIQDVDVPDAPSLTLPPVPSLDNVSVPDFGGLQLPEFVAELPEFEASPLPGILQWTEPEYAPEILDEVMDKIRELWSGGSGIPPAVEQAMVERAMSREDMIAHREIDAVSEEFSTRGFTMPTGIQAARVDQMRQDLALKKLSANRELT